MEEALLKGGGILGAIIVALGLYILYRDKQQKKERDEHRKERDEWRVNDDKKFDRLNEIADDTKDVLSKLTTLLETRNRR